MKIIFITTRKRVEHFTNLDELPDDYEFVWAGYDKTPEEIAAMAPDAEVILVDAIAPVPGELIKKLPKLKMIHSEGVGYEAIDVKTAHEQGVYVCNNKGCNAHAVAEQAILLMLAVLKRMIKGHAMTSNGRQIEAKTNWIMEGIPELGSKKVGIVGMGDIGKETARLCRAFGCEVVYFNRHPLTKEAEEQYGVKYLPLDQLLGYADIVSLHIASNAETFHFMNLERFKMMKKEGILINTARGELVENEALIQALEDGIIAAAGLDTVAPEPVLSDNPLLNVSEEIAEKITFSPHIGGVTEQTFYRIYKTVWDNIRAVDEGREPIHIV